jgi:ketose-bisphosphate aldolase
MIKYVKMEVGMKKLSFKEELWLASRNHYAVGAFNIFNYTSAKAALTAAEELDVSIILQTSMATVKKYQAAKIGRMLRMLADQARINVLLHLDHCTSVELARKCIDSGWDSVMIDASRLPLEENIEITQEVVAYAHSKGVYVEGELGTIAGVEDEISVTRSQMADFENSHQYVGMTGIDAFAPAIGTAHGLYHGEPTLNLELLEKLHHSLGCPLVIHGGTGLDAATFRRLVALGAAKINVSTALKHAYLNGSKEYLQNNPDKFDPLDFDAVVASRITAVVKEHLQLFRESAGN